MSSGQLIPTGAGEGIPQSEALPTFVAKRWQFSLQEHERDGVTYYSIRDWVAGLTGSSPDRARIIWKDFKRKHSDTGGVFSVALPYLASDGKPYETDFTNDEGLYRLAVLLHVSKNRPVLREIKDYLARAGVFVDEARRDPERAEEKLALERRSQYSRQGKSEDWIATREQSVVTRKQFVGSIYSLVQNKDTFGALISAVTRGVYQGVFDSDTQGLRERLGIAPKESIRDHFGRIALSYTTIAEESIRIHLSRYHDQDAVPVPVIFGVVQTLSDAIGVQASQLADALQIDLVSGRPLLEGPTPKQGQLGASLQKAAPTKPHRS